MIKYIVRRLLLLIPVLLGMTLISFGVTKAIPTDPIIASISQEAANHPEIVAAYRKEWGLDKPVPVQVRHLCLEPSARRHGRVDLHPPSRY